MELSTGNRRYVPPSRSLSDRDLNLLALYRASGEPIPLDVQARLIEAGVIIRHG